MVQNPETIPLASFTREKGDILVCNYISTKLLVKDSCGEVIFGRKTTKLPGLCTVGTERRNGVLQGIF